MVLFQKRKIYKFSDGAIYVERRNKRSLHVVVFCKMDFIKFEDSCDEIKISNHIGYDANLPFYTNGDVEECIGPYQVKIRATDVIDKFEMPLLYIPRTAKIDSLNIHCDGISAKHAITDESNWWYSGTWEPFE